MRLKVRLLGGLSAVWDSDVITHFRTQKTAALMAYLAFHADVPQSREVLVERFWPEAELDQARMSLRTALSALRKQVGESLHTDPNRVTLAADTDLVAFQRALRLARRESLTEPERMQALAEAVEHYTGPLMPGFYEDWVLLERDRLAAQQVAALSALARWHVGLNELEPALDYARRAAAADPLNEEVRADLIRWLRRANRTTEALRQFQDLHKLFEEQLGISPSAATASLVEGLSPREDTPAERRVHLPLTLGRFHGRRDLLSSLLQQLSGRKGERDENRLVTMFGPGGIGKTRLAIEAARRLAALHLFSSVYFVGLAAAQDLETVWSELHSGLKLPVLPNTPYVQQIAAQLRHHGPTVLICDNLEQALPAAALAVEELLRAVPDLTIITTSRQRLAIPGEALLVVGALSPDEAIALFEERARSVEPAFRISDTNRADVQALVNTLEGSPLGIELAAAWVGVLGVGEMARQLTQSRLSLPETPRRQARHASVRAAIAWSADLLDPDLRAGLFRLSVFDGGWDLKAAQAVCEVGAQALASLRDRALLTSELAGDIPRFFLHESVHTFGAESLDTDTRQTLHQRHTEHFLSRAEVLNPEQPRDRQWARDLADLIPNEANLRLACHHGNAEQKARFAIALTPFWLHRGRFAEGDAACTEAQHEKDVPPVYISPLALARAQLAYSRNQNVIAEENLKAVVEKEKGALRTRALILLAQLALYNRDNSTQAEQYLAQIETTTPEQKSPIECLRGTIHLYRGDMEAARRMLTAAARDAQAVGELVTAAHALNNLGNALHQVGALPEARESYQRALALRDSLGLRVEVLRTRIGLANVAAAGKDFEAALTSFEQATQEAAEIGDCHTEAVVLSNQAAILHELGRISESLPLAVRSLERKAELGLTSGVALSLNNIANTLTLLGESETGALLHGAAMALRQRAGIALGPSFEQQLEHLHQVTRAALGTDTYQHAFEQGSALSEPELFEQVHSAMVRVNNIVVQ